MEIKDYTKTVRTTEVVHIYDAEKDMNWFVCLEKTNGSFGNNGAKEMMNYDIFKEQGADYMLKVYNLASAYAQTQTP